MLCGRYITVVPTEGDGNPLPGIWTQSSADCLPWHQDLFWSHSSYREAFWLSHLQTACQDTRICSGLTAHTEKATALYLYVCSSRYYCLQTLSEYNPGNLSNFLEMEILELDNFNENLKISVWNSMCRVRGWQSIMQQIGVKPLQ